MNDIPTPRDLHNPPPAPDMDCPHCPDGHTPADGGSQPWGVYVAAERDGDGQPVRLHVERSGGAHVAESDAEWVRARLNGGGLVRHGDPIDIGWTNGSLDARLVLTVDPGMDDVEREQLLADLRDTIGRLVPVRPARQQEAR